MKLEERTKSQYEKDESLRALEEEARQAKRGLWQDPKPVPPWKWRKRKEREEADIISWWYRAWVSLRRSQRDANGRPKRMPGFGSETSAVTPPTQPPEYQSEARRLTTVGTPGKYKSGTAQESSAG